MGVRCGDCKFCFVCGTSFHGATRLPPPPPRPSPHFLQDALRKRVGIARKEAEKTIADYDAKLLACDAEMQRLKVRLWLLWHPFPSPAHRIPPPPSHDVP